MMKSFRKEYGNAISLPANAITYEITNGGTNLPDTLEDLVEMVNIEMSKYNDIYSKSTKSLKH